MNLYDELITILQDGKELGFTYDEIDDIIQALERAKKVEELLGLYREYYGHIPYSDNPRLIYCEEKIDELEDKLEEELK